MRPSAGSAPADASSLRVAYLVTTHRDVAQVARLVDTIRAGDPLARIYISHDSTGEPGALELRRPGAVEVQLATGGRGDHTQVDRILGLHDLVTADGGADYVVFLSGEDYPCRPLTQMKSALLNSGDGFLHHFPIEDDRSDWSRREGRLRYRYRWYAGWPISTSWRDRLHPLHALSYLQPVFAMNVAYGRIRLGVRRWRDDLGLELHGGSAWCSLSWRAFDHAYQTISRRPELQRWIRRSLAVDEAAFQTVLLENESFTFEATNRRHIVFGTSRFGHPSYLEVADLPQILNSEAFFARKIRSSSTDLLDRLDAEVLGARPDREVVGS